MQSKHLKGRNPLGLRAKRWIAVVETVVVAISCIVAAYLIVTGTAMVETVVVAISCIVAACLIVTEIVIGA
nr:hypothetical protein [Candidatus Sigynarchaeota archaeon]